MLKTKRNDLPLHLYKNLIDVMAKSNKTFHKIVEENKKVGIATPFSLQGRIYHLMPDGRILLKKNYTKKNKG